MCISMMYRVIETFKKMIIICSVDNPHPEKFA